MESNDSPEIADRGETSDIPGLPSGMKDEEEQRRVLFVTRKVRQKPSLMELLPMYLCWSQRTFPRELQIRMKYISPNHKEIQIQQNT